MKRAFRESKFIGLYVIFWGGFLLGVVGVLLALAFSETRDFWEYIGLGSFLLSVGCFILTLLWIFEVQREIQERFFWADKGEKRFLKFLFYFARGQFLIFGAYFVLLFSFQEDVPVQDLTEISGQIATIELTGAEDDPRTLKIVFENSSNEYESHIFKIPENSLERIQAELHTGDFVSVLIENEDKDKTDDLFIQIYGIRTEDKTYLSFEEFSQADSANQFVGFILGLTFAIPGLIYMLAGRINAT